MAGSEEYWNPNTKRVEGRETRDASDVARATAKYDPRTSGMTADEAGRPKRAEFPQGLAGDAEFTKATRRFAKLKQQGQESALGAMK